MVQGAFGVRKKRENTTKKKEGNSKPPKRLGKRGRGPLQSEKIKTISLGAGADRGLGSLGVQKNRGRSGALGREKGRRRHKKTRKQNQKQEPKSH